MGTEKYDLPRIDGTASVKIPRDFNALADAVDLNLSKEVERLDIITSAISNGSPKGVFETIGALQLAKPNGDTNIYVVTADGKWYYWNSIAWTAGGIYQTAEGVVTTSDFSKSLVGGEQIDVINSNFINKITGSINENGNRAFRDGGGAVKRPDQFAVEFDQTRYNNLATLNGSNVSQGANTSGQMGLFNFGFDVIKKLTEKYGDSVFQGETTLVGKIAVAKKTISQLVYHWSGFASFPNGFGVTIGSYNYTTNTWDVTQSHNGNTIQPLTLTVSDLANRIHPTNGFIYLIAYPNALSDGVTPSSVNTDYCDVDISVPLSFDKRYYTQKTADTLMKNIPGFFDYTNNVIVRGLRLFDSNTLTSSIDAGVAYVNGKRVEKATTNVTYQANKDTYVDLDDNGNYQFTVVANGSPAPAIAANCLRIGSIVTDSIEVTSNRSYNSNFSLGFETLTKKGLHQHNTAVGYQALKNNQADGVIFDNGLYNTALGSWALKENTTGNHNTGLGFEALMNTTTGVQNTGVGEASMFFNTTGNHNTALGVHVMMQNTTGNYNVAVGNYALELNTTGEKNTAIGNNAGKNPGNFSNSTAIGANAPITESNAVQLGDANVTKVKSNGSFEALDIGDGFICKSPDGMRWKITVANDGHIVASLN